MIIVVNKDVDLDSLTKYSFHTAPYEEFLKYMIEDDYIWINKGTRVVDFTTVRGGKILKESTPATMKVINKMKRDGVIEEIEEDTRSNTEKAEALLKELKSKTEVEC